MPAALIRAIQGPPLVSPRLVTTRHAPLVHTHEKMTDWAGWLGWLKLPFEVLAEMQAACARKPASPPAPAVGSKPSRTRISCTTGGHQNFPATLQVHHTTLTPSFHFPLLNLPKARALPAGLRCCHSPCLVDQYEPTEPCVTWRQRPRNVRVSVCQGCLLSRLAWGLGSLIAQFSCNGEQGEAQPRSQSRLPACMFCLPRSSPAT